MKGSRGTGERNAPRETEQEREREWRIRVRGETKMKAVYNKDKNEGRGTDERTGEMERDADRGLNIARKIGEEV